jgi:putative lipase involved disintegration of autophagic bodies
MMLLTLLFYINIFTLSTCIIIQKPFTESKEHTLKLKHIYHHATANGSATKLFRRYDIKPCWMGSHQNNLYPLQSMLKVVDRPVTNDIHAFLSSGNRWYINDRSMYLESSIDRIPNVKNRETVLSLAKMSSNAYLDVNLNDTDWYDLGSSWQTVSSRLRYVKSSIFLMGSLEYILWLGLEWNQGLCICQ